MSSRMFPQNSTFHMDMSDEKTIVYFSNSITGNKLGRTVELDTFDNKTISESIITLLDDYHKNYNTLIFRTKEIPQIENPYEIIKNYLTNTNEI